MNLKKEVAIKSLASMENVKQALWANCVEDTAQQLLKLLKERPEHIQYEPDISAELFELLGEYFHADDIEDPATSGNIYLNNIDKAVLFAIKVLDGKQLIDNVIKAQKWGVCNVLVSSHPIRALILSPNEPIDDFIQHTHQRYDHWIIFRDLGDGSCIMHIVETKALLNNLGRENRDISWEVLSTLSKEEMGFNCSVALAQLDEPNANLGA